MGQRFGLSKKIMLVCFVFIFLPLCLMGIKFYSSASSLLEKQLANTNLETVRHFNNYYLDIVNDNLNLFLDIWSSQTNLDEVFTSDSLKSDYEKQWTYALLGYPEVDSIYFGSVKGQMFQIPERPMPQNYDPRTRPWYVGGMAGAGKPVWTKPFKSADTGESIFAVSKQIKNSKGEPAGVLSIAVDLKEMSSLMEEVKYGANGYMMLIDQEGRTVATRNAGDLDKNISGEAWAKPILKQSEGTFSYMLKGKPVLISFVTNEKTGWKLVGVMPKTDLMPKMAFFQALMQKVVMGLSLWGVLVIVAVFILAQWVVVRPLQNLMHSMDRAKEGDMTVINDVTHRGKDEIGQLYRAFEYMLQGQRDILVKALVTATKLKGSSEETKVVANQSMQTARSQSYAMSDMSCSIEDMSQSIHEVMSNMENVSQSLSSFTQAMRDMGLSSSEIARSSVNTSEAIGEVVISIKNLELAIGRILENALQISEKGSIAVSSVKDGKQVVDYAIVEMDQVQVSMDGLSQVMENLSVSVQEIGKITRVINDLSVQTNLLSLNASIEAARAGEHGSGFAVVASAIGQLAEKSKASTKSVEKIIQQIGVDMKDASEYTRKSVEQIESGIAHVNETKPAFQNVLEAIGEAVRLIEEMNVATTEQWKASRAIMDSTNKVNALTKQVSEASGSQLSTLEELITTTEIINSLTGDVTERGLAQAANSEILALASQTLNEMTKDGMISSEKVDQIASELNEQASDLVELVAKFKM